MLWNSSNVENLANSDAAAKLAESNPEIGNWSEQQNHLIVLEQIQDPDCFRVDHAMIESISSYPQEILGV